MFFKIAKILFKGRVENEKFVCDPRKCFACSENYCNVVEAILRWYWKVLNVILIKSPINIIS
jgi:hypothetical protein